MYKSYSYNNMPQPVNTFGHTAPEPPVRAALPEPSLPPKSKPVPEPKAEPIPAAGNKPEKNKAVIGRLKTDDMILLIVVILLLLNDCDDKLLLISLAFIFFSDYFN